MSEKKLEIFGWVGTALSIIMYVSYIPQIIHNLNGIKGTPIQLLPRRYLRIDNGDHSHIVKPLFGISDARSICPAGMFEFYPGCLPGKGY